MKENSDGNDTNVGSIGNSIEEDIKILEEFKTNGYSILLMKYGDRIKTNFKLEKAIEHILSDYKRVLKENEELKEKRQIVGIPVKNKRDGRIGIVLHQWESGSVAVLESINPRVINTHDSWNTLEIVTDEVKQTQTKCETIPVSLVKDKIEQLEKNELFGKYNFEQIKFAVDALQELLEGRE